ncbi:deoxyguanosinetriphosphate triphosphohydrolase-like protein [Candidatus Omnitrophus magneticus]|uniref:Deoxyguanosinetriphosphate triphosphohydrolase-like protein n=1 Tax=Candidatus Omnitrophus magneticus TaxID=1609969 RepID=A0A0F0CL92_9BACT|nr:deoxyguanosinetriphosphate triphosphohydrolase-like protein [Candidatus Omnitrophus magneticus]
MENYRKKIEEREHSWLAPYAMKSGESLGRTHEEPEHPYRSKYQRDKDRIVYSTAFRRLEYKTQVFVNHEGDYYRTRLTHTLEVAQIARTLARALCLNEDLVEAIALAHDLGHTPFGHAGEEALGELMNEHGGFDHNSHGLRVVDLLEERYHAFKGLNLTHEVRRGIIKHSTPFDEKRTKGVDIPGPWLLEIQIVDIADEIAYDNHDLDDGLKSGLLLENSLSGIELWDEAVNYVNSICKTSDTEIKRFQIIRHLINIQVSDVINSTLERINLFKIKSLKDLDSLKERMVNFSAEMKQKRIPLRNVLINKLYKHSRVARMSYKAVKFLKDLFQVYLNNPELLPPNALERINEKGKHQTICDYIAGMTDRYALDQYKKLFVPYERV